MRTGLLTLLSILIIISCEDEPIQVEQDSCFGFISTDTIDHNLESKWTFLGFKNKSTGKEVCKPSSLGDMSISFEYDNRLKAISSCNSFDGYFNKTINDSLQIDSLTTTLKYCGNDTVIDWEEDYFTSLDKTISYKINHDLLTLVTSSELDLIFRFDNDNNPIANNCFDFNTGYVDKELFIKWILIGYVENQEYCKPDNIPEMTIEFSDINRFEAFGSCNHFEGDFEVFDNDSIKTTDVMTTLIHCTNDTIRDWEEKYYNGLQNAIKYEIEGIKLTLETDNNYKFIFKAE